MANKTSLGCSIRVGISSRKSEELIPLIGSSLVSRSKRRDISLRGCASRLCGVVGSTDVTQLIANTVGDNIWVQGFLLALVDDWVNSLECELGFTASIDSGLKFDGWGAGSKVETGD